MTAVSERKFVYFSLFSEGKIMEIDMESRNVRMLCAEINN